MDENFDLLSEQDKNDAAYKACLATTTITGLAVGGFVGGIGAPAGFVAGAAWGLLTCGKIAPYVKRKLFSRTERLNDNDIVAFIKEIRNQHPRITKKDALSTLAAVQSEITANPDKYKV